MFIIYPLINYNGRAKRLGVIYRNVRMFMRNRGVVLGNGYFVPDKSVERILKELEGYKQDWIDAGGEPDQFNILQFEILCNDLPTYKYCLSAVKQSALERMEKTYNKLKYVPGFADIRRLRGVIQDIGYVTPFAVLFPQLKDARATLVEAFDTLKDDAEKGKELLLQVMEILREDSE